MSDVMPFERKLTRTEYAAIESHCSILIDGCEQSIAKLSDIPKDQRSHVIIGQLSYWRHAKSALTWAIKVAGQRRKNVDRSESGSV